MKIYIKESALLRTMIENNKYARMCDLDYFLELAIERADNAAVFKPCAFPKKKLNGCDYMCHICYDTLEKEIMQEAEELGLEIVR